MKKQELEKRYKEVGSIQLSKELGISKPTLIKYLKENKIEVKQVGRPRKLKISWQNFKNLLYVE